MRIDPSCDLNHPIEFIYIISGIPRGPPEDNQYIVHIQFLANFIGLIFVRSPKINKLYMASPTVAIWVLFQVLLSTMTVLLDIPVI